MNIINIITECIIYSSVAFALSNALFSNIFERKNIFYSLVCLIANAAFFYYFFTL